MKKKKKKEAEIEQKKNQRAKKGKKNRVKEKKEEEALQGTFSPHWQDVMIAVLPSSLLPFTSPDIFLIHLHVKAAEAAAD